MARFIDSRSNPERSERVTMASTKVGLARFDEVETQHSRLGDAGRYATNRLLMPKRIYTHAYAPVRFMASNLDPMLIIKALRLPPDRQCRRGEPSFRRTTKGRVNELPECQLGLWSMSSEKWVESPRLETHLQWLLDELEP